MAPAVFPGRKARNEMKAWKVKITVYVLGGQETREMEVQARTMLAAERKAVRIMGNRDFHIHGATLVARGTK